MEWNMQFVMYTDDYLLTLF